MNVPNWHFSLMAPVYDTIGGMINRLDPVELLEPDDGDRVLDLGGGTGLLRPKFNGVNLSSWTVLDLNYRMLLRGRENGRNCHFVQGSADQLPFSTGRFDRALITDALHHMGQQEQVLSEAARVLRDGGTLLIEEFDPTTPIGKITEWAEWLGAMGSQFVRPDTLCQRVRTAGLSIEQTRRHQYLFYILARSGDRNSSNGRTLSKMR